MQFQLRSILFLLIALVLLSLTASPAITYAQDSRYFPQTGYSVNNNDIWEYFQARGGVTTFGYPVSHAFLFRGFTVQIFQRHVIQVVGEQARPINLLDPSFMPITQLNNSTFPAYDPALAAAAPAPETANYGEAVREHLVATVPNVWEGQQVDFLDYYFNASPPGTPGLDTLVSLEVWGFPTSHPMRDPNNFNFVYQRFQRGIMHYDATTGSTGGILLGDAFKSLLTGTGLPSDLATDLADSPFLRLYDPNQPNALARTYPNLDPPITRENTDMRGAFEPGATPPADAPVFSEVDVYLIRLEDAGSSGPFVGCGDSAVAVQREIEPTQAPLTAAFQELLSMKERTYADNLYNALYRTDLHIDDIALEQGTATISLVGEYQIGGTCDEPRVEAQLEYTALQFSTVDRVQIYINGQPLGNPSGG